MVKNGKTTIMIGKLDTHKIYCVNISSNELVSILLSCAMTAVIFLLPTDLTIWQHRFANLNRMNLKHVPDMTQGIKILVGAKDLSSCTICIPAKMTKEPHRDPNISSEIPGFCIYLNIRGGTNVYATWESYCYFALLVDNATRVT